MRTPNTTALLDRFDRWLRAQNRSPHTASAYRRDLLTTNRHLPKGRTLTNATPDDIATALVSIEASRLLSPISRCRLVGALKTFYKWTEATGITRSNPASNFRMSRPGEPPVRWLEKNESERLQEAMAEDDSTGAQRDRVLIALFLGTGLRISEAVGLRWGDMDFQRALIHLRKTKGGHPQSRIIPTRLNRVLMAWRKSQSPQPDDPVFPGRNSQPVSQRHVARRLRQWSEVAGLPAVHPHQLRHTFATRLYHVTGDLLIVQGALGHRSLTSTRRYTHADPERIRRAVEAV